MITDATADHASDVAREAAAVLDLAMQQQADKLTASADPRNRNRITLMAPVNIRAAAGNAKGPPTFDMVAYTGGPMKLEGWDYPVVIDMTGIEGLNESRPALRDHDPGKVVGHTTQHTSSKTACSTPVALSAATARTSMRWFKPAKNQFPWQASVGADTLDNEFVPQGMTAQANGRTFAGPINIARRTALGEISFVARGADEQHVRPHRGQGRKEKYHGF